MAGGGGFGAGTAAGGGGLGGIQEMDEEDDDDDGDSHILGRRTCSPSQTRALLLIRTFRFQCFDS